MKAKPLISKNMVYRVPLYLTVARNLMTEGYKYITAPMIAKITTINVETVKKDLSQICKTPGNPKLGREASLLVEELLEFGVYTKVTSAILIGVGHLGRALLNYNFQGQNSIRISAGFDINEDIANTILEGVPIYHINDLVDQIEAQKFEVAILAVPGDHGQSLADDLVEAGIKGIMNFTPIRLSVPETVRVLNVDLSNELQSLIYFVQYSDSIENDDSE